MALSVKDNLCLDKINKYQQVVNSLHYEGALTGDIGSREGGKLFGLGG